MFARMPFCAALVAATLVVALCLTSFAAATISDQQLATDFTLQRKLLRDQNSNILGAKLWNDQHEVLIFADMSFATIDNQLVSLDDAIVVGENCVNVPSSIVRILRSRLPYSGADEPMEPSDNFTVVIDPGHGGKDKGATGVRGSFEKNVNLQVSLMLAPILREKGVKVILTRSTDVFIPLERRVQIANEANCDLFVSVHANSIEKNRRMQGYMVLFPADEWDDPLKGNVTERARDAAREGGVALKNVDMSCRSRTAATTIYGALLEQYRRQSYAAATAIRAGLSRAVPSADRGNRKDWRGLRVLMKTYCPAVLVELDYLSNPTAEARLVSRTFQKRLAQALGDGILNFLTAGRGSRT